MAVWDGRRDDESMLKLVALLDEHDSALIRVELHRLVDRHHIILRKADGNGEYWDDEDIMGFRLAAKRAIRRVERLMEMRG